LSCFASSTTRGWYSGMQPNIVAQAFSICMQESIKAVIQHVEYAKSKIMPACKGSATLSARVHCSGHRECHGRHYGEPGSVTTCFVHPGNCTLAGMSNTNEPSATGYCNAMVNKKEIDGLGLVKVKLEGILKDVVDREMKEQLAGELLQTVVDGTSDKEAISKVIRQICLPSTPLCIALKIEATTKAISRIMQRFLPQSHRLCHARISVPVQPYPKSTTCGHNLGDSVLVESLQKVLHLLKQCEEKFIEAAIFRSLLSMPATACCQDVLESDEEDELDAEASPNVIQDVAHTDEEVATRDVDLLREQAEQDWADSVSEVIRSDLGTTDEGNDMDQVFLFPYMRAPKEFKDALLEGLELRFVREKMRDAGQECILQPSGAKVFVWPEQYSIVIDALKSKEIQLRASYVIIAESLLPSLEASIASIQSKKNVRPKKEGIICVASASVLAGSGSASVEAANGTDQGVEDAEEMTVNADIDNEWWQHVFDVNRLSLVRVLRNPGSVNQSTTEAHGGVNPRRYGGLDPAPVSHQ